MEDRVWGRLKQGWDSVLFLKYGVQSHSFCVSNTRPLLSPLVWLVKYCLSSYTNRDLLCEMQLIKCDFPRTLSDLGYHRLCGTEKPSPSTHQSGSGESLSQSQQMVSPSFSWETKFRAQLPALDWSNLFWHAVGYYQQWLAIRIFSSHSIGETELSPVPLLYVLVAETLCQAIRKDPHIEGIHIPGSSGHETRISQYVDGTLLHPAFRIIDSFE